MTDSHGQMGLGAFRLGLRLAPLILLVPKPAVQPVDVLLQRLASAFACSDCLFLIDMGAADIWARVRCSERYSACSDHARIRNYKWVHVRAAKRLKSRELRVLAARNLCIVE